MSRRQPFLFTLHLNNLSQILSDLLSRLTQGHHSEQCSLLSKLLQSSDGICFSSIWPAALESVKVHWIVKATPTFSCSYQRELTRRPPCCRVQKPFYLPDSLILLSSRSSSIMGNLGQACNVLVMALTSRCQERDV